MSTISLNEIRRDPSAFLARVEAGEAFVVTRGDEIVAEVRPAISVGQQPRPSGLCAGQFTTPDNFNDPLPDDILKEFDGT